MSQKYPLQETLSPINREGRDRINENWARIMAYFEHVQLQIKALAGGREVGELIARLEQAIENAETDVQKYIVLVDTTVKQAIEANNTATQDAIAANNAALQTALDTVAARLIEVTQAISNAETATEDATNAKNAAIQATQDAQVAIDTMQSLIDNFGSRGAWSSTTQYFKNNLVGLDGRTYIALQENINTPVTNQSVWTLFADKGAQGAEGPRGLPGKDGTGVNIITSLDSEDELPPIGSPGDAYMINGDMYVWKDNLGIWDNVGPIQGPPGKDAYDIAVENGFEGTMEEWIESLKGAQGPPGPDGPAGPPGQDADLTEITAQLDQMKPKVDNSWQKGVYNDTGITNLGQYTATRTYHVEYTDWQAPSSNFEMVSIFIPIGVFSGSVKVSIISDYNHTDAFGLFEYINSCFKRANGTLGTNSRTILKADSKVTNDFYFPDFNFSNSLFTIPVVRKPNAKNSLTIKVELMSNRNDTLIFNALSDSYIYFEDLGTSWSGYPWTPQTSNIPSSAEKNLWNRKEFVSIVDNRNTNPAHLKKPVDYINTSSKGTITEFVELANFSLSEFGLYGVLETTTPWNDISVTPYQYIRTGAVTLMRLANGVNAWGTWTITEYQGLGILDLFQSVSDVKTNVAAAITDKGVPTSPTATGAQMAANIRAIPTGVKSAEMTLSIPQILSNQETTVTTSAVYFLPKYSNAPMAGAHFHNGIVTPILSGDIIGFSYIRAMSINAVGATGYSVSVTIRNPTNITHPARNMKLILFGDLA
ncbi:hypothetical protein [Lysinibacillus sp. NPDC047702]|uniref:hypothetical protein n=1 Tax=unclassified Lysinibacillus TaxID=2636778 RepID=UPI003D021AB3